MEATAALPQRRIRRRKRDVHRADRVFQFSLRAPTLALIAVLLAIAAFLAKGAWPAIQALGWRLLLSTGWDPNRADFGALPAVYGTLVSSAIALAIAGPLGIGTALFLTEVAPTRVAKPLGILVELLAAIPSVVYGLWGLSVLVPWLRTQVEPTLGDTLGFLPLFQGPRYGVGMLAAGFILAIMILPTIASVTREIFRAVPTAQREAALGLGATRWEMIRVAVLGASTRGVAGALMLGLGRALGETMAVTMVIGNRHEITASLFAPGVTMASLIANEYTEATEDLHLAALVGIGLILFSLTLLVNAAARFAIARKAET